MADIVTIAIPGAVVISVVSAFVGKYADGWVKRNRNGNKLLSKNEHDAICKNIFIPIIERLERGEKRFDKIETFFDELRDKSNERHIEIIREIAALRK